ncbi:hypothetical protein HCJ45_13315 [Listeria sp. FSL L7-1517]|uniref:toll/interleukin-1 receptor domain-containing protein n=1 Tax=Listeria immobilis TaxID=2713502 RepID=UPI00164D8874|nr:toll/interleukin-1 receptor domain-containing protein [Listeria immobilis]MBC6298089.1 hypothetical protein [Listeria immobilis]
MLWNILKSPKNQSIFLSHNSIDRQYGNVLRGLMVSIGILNSDIVYTSHEKNKIPIGENIYNYLGRRIERSNIILFLLSEDYFKSVVCLNEMGASWVTKNDYYMFFVPGFDKRSKEFMDCCINQTKMGIVLNGDNNCKQGLREFVTELSLKMKLDVPADILYDEVEKSCDLLRKLKPSSSVYAASITDIIKYTDYIFCKIDILIPTGERFHEEESHWLQLYYKFIPIAQDINIGARVKFKVKSVTDFETQKYGNHNFRNIYVYPDFINLI